MVNVPSAQWSQCPGSFFGIEPPGHLRLKFWLHACLYVCHSMYTSVYFQTGYYFIMRFCKLQVFCSEEMAKIELARLKRCKVDKEYYKGKFKLIAGNIWFFEYDNTYRASDATINDHNVVMTTLLTDEILPPVQIFLTIRLDIICISEAGVDERVKQGVKRVLDQLDDETKKKIKIDFKTPIEGLGLEPAALEHAATAVPQSVMTVPDEDSTSDNIIAQINAFAENKGLKFYRNVAKITEYGINKFTKYGYSRPDAASHHCLLTTEDRSVMAFFNPTSGNADDFCKKMDDMILTFESKNPPKDPIGQLFAGMEKTMGDITFSNVMESTIPAHITMYGLYFIPSEDTCEVYKAYATINTDTVVNKGTLQLHICDAINRVLHQLLLHQKRK